MQGGLAADHSVSEGYEVLEGAETLESLWQQKAGPEPVDLFESAVKHRAGGYTAQRTRKREKRASEHGEGCA